MHLEPGTRLGNYEILSLLGAGGMGQVYKALDLKLERHVAIKILAGALDRESEKERFLQEARAASALDHPNIGAVHTIDETPDGRLYIAGSVLRDYIYNLQGRNGGGLGPAAAPPDIIIDSSPFKRP